MYLALDSPDSLLASCFSKHIDNHLFLITGAREAGKTQWCLSLAEAAGRRGISTEGLISPGIFDQGVRLGIDLMDIRSGERRRLAIKHDDSATKVEINSIYSGMDWLLDPAVLAWGNAVLSRASTRELLILDELGPLEFLENTGLTAGLHLVDQRAFRLACVVVRPGLVTNALERWPWARLRYVSPPKHRKATHDQDS